MKRRRGQPAHISRASIVKAAISFIEKDPNFSLYGLAKSLDVKPGTIHFHFEGAGAKQQLITEMVRTVLQPLARGFNPRETGYNYLRDLFWRAWLIFDDHRNLALSVGAELSADPLISPPLLGRTLAALSDAGLPDDALAEAAERVMAGLIAFISIEFPPRRHKIARDSVDDLATALRNLPEGGDYYAIARERAEDVVARAADRVGRLSGAKANRAFADGFADFILRGLGLEPATAGPRRRR